MKKTISIVGITALVLAYGTVGAIAQSQPDQHAYSPGADQEEVGTTGQGGMGQGGMMCGGMMGRGMMAVE